MAGFWVGGQISITKDYGNKSLQQIIDDYRIAGFQIDEAIEYITSEETDKKVWQFILDLVANNAYDYNLYLNNCGDFVIGVFWEAGIDLERSGNFIAYTVPNATFEANLGRIGRSGSESDRNHVMSARLRRWRAEASALRRAQEQRDFLMRDAMSKLKPLN